MRATAAHPPLLVVKSALASWLPATSGGHKTRASSSLLVAQPKTVPIGPHHQVAGSSMEAAARVLYKPEPGELMRPSGASNRPISPAYYYNCKPALNFMTWPASWWLQLPLLPTTTSEFQFPSSNSLRPLARKLTWPAASCIFRLM